VNIVLWNDTLTYHPRKKEICEKISRTIKSKGITRGANNPRFGKFGKDSANYGMKYHYAPGVLELRNQRMSEVRKKLGLSKGEENPMFGKTHTKEVKDRIRNALKSRGGYRGTRNPRALVYIVTDPNGTVFEVAGELHKFCDDQGLWYEKMLDIRFGRATDYKRWTCRLK
jgi:hypothetical protein